MNFLLKQTLLLVINSIKNYIPTEYDCNIFPKYLVFQMKNLVFQIRNSTK